MILWLILSVIACVIVFFCVKKFLKEETEYGYRHFGWIIPCVLIATLIISLIVSACAPRQYKPNEENMLSQTICENITITPNVQNRQTYTNYYNIEYQIAGTKVTLSEEAQIYNTDFEVSTTGYPYIEKYYCDFFSPVRNFLYGSFGRPRWYYKIYLVPTE